MSFSLRALRHFVTLAQKLNYARAAESIGIAQPTLSRSIQSLESHLGLRLFDRDRSGVHLTFQGEELYNQATALLADADALERSAVKSGLGKRGRVRFGIAPMPARATLAATLLDRQAAAPDVSYDVVVRRVSDMIPLLQSGDIEFFVAAEGQVSHLPTIRTEILGQFPINFLVRKGHPLMDGPLDDINFPLLLASGPTPKLPPLVSAKIAEPPTIIEDFDTLRMLTQKSDAIWLSSSYAVAQEIREGSLCIIQDATVEPGHMNMVLHSLGRRSRSPATQTLITSMRGQMRKLASELSA